MSGTDRRGHFLHQLPSPVFWDFCRVMDGLSDLDWTRFASEVLCDQNSVRLAERKERRTEFVMLQWETRNGTVGELIHLLQRLQLLRPCDIITGWTSTPQPVLPPPPPPTRPHSSLPPYDLSRFDAPPKSTETLATVSIGRQTASLPAEDKRGGKVLPRPAPPPPHLRTNHHSPPPSEVTTPESSLGTCGAGGCGVMCWSYEEVHAETKGFSASLQVGEGGFGVVYRAVLGNADCAVKRLKQDCIMDLSLLKQAFQTEVEKLSKFRHPNIVNLLGVCEGGGSMCLIYSYMENRSLEEKLHNQCGVLSWSQRLSIVEDVSSALAFLHCPPDKQAPLIHGDVKSSNILLDRHLVAKLADFGLARCLSHGSSGLSPSRTVSVGKTATIRGTLAYLPDEYVRHGELSTTVDVYSFGVVLLEILTGRRALERDVKCGERFLKDLVEEVEESPLGSCAAEWRKHLDQRLITGGAAEPAEWMTVLALACSCLDKKRKKRPKMKEVCQKLKDINNPAMGNGSSFHRPPPPHLDPSSQSIGCPSSSMDSRVGSLTEQMSQMGPLKDTATPPRPSSSSVIVGPCESDESRGFSQFRSDRTSWTPLSNQDQSHCGPSEFSSVPTEDQYSFSRLPSSSTDQTGAGVLTGPDTRGTDQLYGAPGCFSPVGSLKSLTLEPAGQKKQKNTPGAEPVSPDNLSCGWAASRQPEESDELDFLSSKHS